MRQRGKPVDTVSLLARAKVLVRCSAIAILTGVLLSCRMLIAPVATISPSRDQSLRALIFRAWGKGTLRIAGFRLRVEGEPPGAPFVLVSNHLSYLDIVVYASIVGEIFVSMAEVATWPIFGFMARQMNTLFVDRADRRDVVRVNEQISGLLATGHGVTLFPESTTSRGEDVLPFRSALLEPAARAGVPVHFASIHYETGSQDPPASESVCWADQTPFGEHARGVLRLHGVDVRVRFGDAPVEAEDRKQLASKLVEAVRAMVRAGH